MAADRLGYAKQVDEKGDVMNGEKNQERRTRHFLLIFLDSRLSATSLLSEK